MGCREELNVAERAGFEPARSLRPYAISSRARSSTPAPLRARTIPTIIGSAMSSRKFRLSRRRLPIARHSVESQNPESFQSALCRLSRAYVRVNRLVPKAVGRRVLLTYVGSGQPSPSFPRKRESMPLDAGKGRIRRSLWIPAFAGMTGMPECCKSNIHPC